MKEERSAVMYIIAEAFREKLSQVLGRELHVVAQFDGDCFYVSNVLRETAIKCCWLYFCNCNLKIYSLVNRHGVPVHLTVCLVVLCMTNVAIAFY